LTSLCEYKGFIAGTGVFVFISLLSNGAPVVAGQPAQEEAPEEIAQEKHETKRIATEAPEKNKKQNRSLWARLRGRR
jgi:hypothetical protein